MRKIIVVVLSLVLTLQINECLAQSVIELQIRIDQLERDLKAKNTEINRLKKQKGKNEVNDKNKIAEAEEKDNE